MLLIDCPWCGPRDETEFAYGGEAHVARPLQPEALSDEEWVAYLFLNSNTKGAYPERWRHAHGCRRWFNMVRDTHSHAVIEIYPMGALPQSEAGKQAYAESWRRTSAAEQNAQGAASTTTKAGKGTKAS